MVAQSLVRLQKGDKWTDLTTDMRSAVNKFAEFSEATGVARPKAEDDAGS